MLRKTVLLTGLVAVAVGLMAPASASAWIRGGEALKEDGWIKLDGPATFSSAIGGITCNSKSKITLKAGLETGTVNYFQVFEPGKCVGTGALAPCVIKEVIANAGWAVKENIPAGRFEIESASISYVLEGKCPINKTTVSFPTLAASPDNVKEMSTVTITGSGTSKEATLGIVTALMTTEVLPVAFYGL